MTRLRRIMSRLRVAVTVALAFSALGLPSNASAAVKSGVAARSLSSAHAAGPCGVGDGPGVVITSQPEPCTVTIKVGAVTGITLERGFRWAHPKSSSGVVAVSDVSRSATGGLSATLTAAAVGHATLASEGTIVCPSGTACPALVRRWTVHVNVVSSLVTKRTVTVTVVDGGRHFTLRRGDRLRLSLTGPSAYTWTAPISSNSGVLRRVSSAVGANANALFVAAAPGMAQVTTVDNPNCYPLCLPPSRLFSVTVTVVR